jgi:hypothetical protein
MRCCITRLGDKKDKKIDFFKIWFKVNCCRAKYLVYVKINKSVMHTFFKKPKKSAMKLKKLSTWSA